MTFTTKVNKEKAIFLKKMGWDYQTIAEFLDCSYQWCAINLSSVKRDRGLMKTTMFAMMPFINLDSITKEYPNEKEPEIDA